MKLDNGNPIAVTLTYDGTTLREKLVDATTLKTFSTNYVVNIPSAVGGNMAFIGFSGGSGGWTARQTISKFSFNAAARKD